jgi:hypothetical protein
MAADRNLILVHTPDHQDVQDLQDIARHVQEFASDIEVFIASNDIPSSVTRRRAGRKPSLIFSPCRLFEFRPMRGKVYAGFPIPKLEQIARLKAAGLPVPASVEITPDLKLPEAAFGSHVVVKPGLSQASGGRHITLTRREAVRYRPMSDYPEDHPGRYAPMYVQRFIDTGPQVNHHRVLTLFGAPLLAFKTTSEEDRPSLDDSDDALAAVSVKARRRLAPIRREVTSDTDILQLAQRTYGAFKEVPLQGVDIIRDETSGELFVLEINPGGNTWIFSKGEMTERLKTSLGLRQLTDQFDAFKTAAEVLIERTRAESE